MLYTVGHREVYLKGLAQQKAKGKCLYKTGRREAGVLPVLKGPYSGGYVFRSAEDAQRLIDEEHPDDGYAVFGLDLDEKDWDKVTVLSDDGWWHLLLYDAIITGEIHVDNSDPVSGS